MVPESNKRPVEARRLLVEGIKRSLYGPQTNSDSAWLGSTKPPTLITSDFVETNPFPIGPWMGSSDEEVLARPPVYTYGIGVLFPELDIEQIGALEIRQVEVIREGHA